MAPNPMTRYPLKVWVYDRMGAHYELARVVYLWEGELHHPTEPALLEYADGHLTEAEYHLHGTIHRKNGPACVYYYHPEEKEEGNAQTPLQYAAYYLHGQRHREDGPAFIQYNLRGDLTYTEDWEWERRVNRTAHGDGS